MLTIIVVVLVMRKHINVTVVPDSLESAILAFRKELRRIPHNVATLEIKTAGMVHPKMQYSGLTVIQTREKDKVLDKQLWLVVFAISVFMTVV